MSAEQKRLTKIVQDALYTFSKGKLLRYLAIPEFAHLFMFYLNKEEFFNRLQSRASSKAERDSYSNQFKVLKGMCLSAL